MLTPCLAFAITPRPQTLAGQAYAMDHAPNAKGMALNAGPAPLARAEHAPITELLSPRSHESYSFR